MDIVEEAEIALDGLGLPPRLAHGAAGKSRSAVRTPNPQQLFAALESADFKRAPDVQGRDLLDAWELKPERAHAMLRKVFYKTVDQQFKNPETDPITGVIGFFTGLRGDLAGNAYFDYFMTYLEVLREGWRLGLASVVVERDGGRASILASHLLTFAGDGRPSAVHCVVGQVLSLFDREAAAKHFRAIRDSKDADLVRFFYWDMGALTYFEDSELDRGALADDVRSITDNMKPFSANPAVNDTTIAVSVDPKFFRIYSAWLFFYAQQLPDIDFNFILCADDEQAAELVRDGTVFMEALARLNHNPVPANIHFHAATTPGFVTDAMTFYACARFFALPALLERYTNVYLMDADLYLQDNPTAFLKRLRDVTFSAPATTSAAALSPWRRHMAGNIAANRNLLGSNFLSDLHSYLAHGLRQPASWMLDQNALSYAIERADSGVVESLNRFSRPISTSKFMKTWESNFKTATRQRRS
jgi:hypothetical protein